MLTDEERRFLEQLEVIRVAVDPDWYPMEFVDEAGQHGGIAADYLDLLSQRLGIRFEIAQGVLWADAVKMVRERELDMFAMAAQPRIALHTPCSPSPISAHRWSSSLT